MDENFQRLRAALEERYALEREIGAGGMATVYLARDLRHRRPVALKVVRPDLGTPLGLDRFLREIELAARLQHPHILPVFDSGVVEAGGTPLPWFVMPFVEGETLRGRLQREGALPPDDAVALTGEVADALAYAHGHGVVHRDIKPENILLSGGHAVVADFGVAKAIESGAAAAPVAGPQLTAVGIAIGTPQYMSPEQATGRDVVDARADQYSLGCVLYEMLTGSPPFTGSSAQSIIALAMTAQRPRPSRSRAGVPPGLDPVVARAMAADPAERYPDMSAFAAALRQARGTSVQGGARRWIVPAAAAAIALAAGIGWYATRPPARVVAPGAETIAVMPFSASGPGVEFLGEGMVDLLSTNFDGVAGIRAVDPGAVVRRWGHRGEADRMSRGLELARDLGAGAVVMGSAVSTGGRVRLAADIYSVDGDQLGRAQVDGPADSVLPLVDRLSLTLLRDVWRSREPVPNLDIGALTTDSIEALRSFLQGEQFYRRLAWDSALAAYTRAAEVDSTFALAHFRQALVYGWTGGYGSPNSRAAAAAGERFASRLPARDRRLLAGYALFMEGKPASVDSVRAFVQQYPQAVDGWFLLGEALYHTREFTGVRPEQIIAPFDSVLRRDSSLVPAAIHPLELVLLYRDSSRFERYFRVLQRASSTASINSTRLSADLAWGVAPSDSAVRAAIAGYAPPVLMASYSSFRKDGATSDSVARAYARLQMPVGIGRTHQGVDAGVGGLALRADVLAGLGRLRDAHVLADSVSSFSPAMARSRLRWPVVLGISLDSVNGRVYDSVYRALPATPEGDYVRAMIDLSRGQVAEVRRRLDERLRTLDTLSADNLYPPLLLAAAGWADILSGDSTRGLRRLRQGIDASASPRTAEPSAFLRWQEALALANREESRAEGIDRLRNGFLTEPVFVPLTYFALGRVYESVGQRDSAAVAYGHFLKLWDKADPVFAPRLEEAREALERLSAEPGARSP